MYEVGTVLTIEDDYKGPTGSEHGRRIKLIQAIVTETQCYECISHGYTSGGYPSIYRNSKTMQLHRYLYMQKYGDLPSNIHVLHKCDNTKCINMDHMFIGTHIDNMQDMWSKNRHHRPRGAKSYSAKLTEAAVLFIRKSDLSNKLLAEHFKVSTSTIWCVKVKKTWKDT